MEVIKQLKLQVICGMSGLLLNYGKSDKGFPCLLLTHMCQHWILQTATDEWAAFVR